jgi:hypothetical protein
VYKLDEAVQKLMLSPRLAFGSPRKLPKPRDLFGQVAVLDVAFAGLGQSFQKITLPFIEGLGGRLAAWVDHHDHEEHPRFSADPRFVLASKSEHGACPEMITPELVERIGQVDTIVCHTDFDGLASAAKWMRGGVEPYPGADDDARAIDTRLGRPGKVGERIDRAIRARPRDTGLFGVIVRLLATGLADPGLWELIDQAAEELVPVEQATRRAAQAFARVPPGVAFLDLQRDGFGKIDKTLLLLLGQEREPVSIVLDQHNVSVAARFDSGLNFVELLGLTGGMPTRVSVPRKRAREVLEKLGVAPGSIDELLG